MWLQTWIRYLDKYRYVCSTDKLVLPHLLQNFWKKNSNVFMCMHHCHKHGRIFVHDDIYFLKILITRFRIPWKLAIDVYNFYWCFSPITISITIRQLPENGYCLSSKILDHVQILNHTIMCPPLRKDEDNINNYDINYVHQ